MTANSSDTPITPVTAVVESVERLSPNFVRVVFGGKPLAVVGSDDPAFDQRIKLIFPTAKGRLPKLDASQSWYSAWVEIPEEERGSMRTYSVREWDLKPGRTRLTVDFVLHVVPGATGPASSWAAEAAPGDELLIVAPWRDAGHFGGIEFAPGAAGEVVLAGDETAAPAIARILGDLRDLGTESAGTAFIEVPTADDVVDIQTPDGFAVRWLPRDGRPVGTMLRPAVLAHSGATSEAEDVAADTGVELVWETPSYSALGEEVVPGEGNNDDRYYWIAGESGVVTGLRRTLTKELGVDRSQVAFMGYWKRGVAMRG